MAPKLLAETAGMIGMKELKDAFKEVRGEAPSVLFQETILSSSFNATFFLVTTIV